ncbi:DUF167 domain-containing protein [Candidatus Microgenomates bacterium]|nr:MAG: DUF167 domain-containing protein [Candidatus Microgenomates bacterium]
MKIFVTAKPRAKNEEVKKIDETHFIVSVKEPPVDGKANRAIAKALSDYFDIPISSVIMTSGYTFKIKTFEISLA